MNSNVEEQNKNKVKRREEENKTDDHTEFKPKNFGSVSQDIDNIIGDWTKPHDEKKQANNETFEYVTNQQNHQNSKIKENITNKIQSDKEKIKQETECFNEKTSTNNDKIRLDEQNLLKKEQTGKNIDQFDIEKYDKEPGNPEEDFITDREQGKTKQKIQTNTFIQNKFNDVSKEPQNVIDNYEKPISENIQANKEITSAVNQNKIINSDKKRRKSGFFGLRISTKKKSISDKEDKNQYVFKQNKEKPVNTEKKSINLFSKKKNIQKQTIEQNKPQQTYQSPEDKKEQLKNENDDIEQPIYNQDGVIDQDVLKFLAITDDLLGKLPENVISEFASSEDFVLYKKVMDRYNIGK